MGRVVWCVWCVWMQASVNPKAETVEELQARRKNLHIGMVKLAREDLSLYLQAALDAHAVTPPHLASAPLSPFSLAILFRPRTM